MYNQLNNNTPIVLGDRVTAIEASLYATQAANLLGAHFYAGCGFVPATLTTGTNTAGVATTIFVNEIIINQNANLAGFAFLIGLTGGTDNVIATLYSSTGAVLATSALAGTLVSTASTFQRLAFVTAYAAGPGRYFIGIQTNGTTATIATQAAGNHYAGQITGQTFGTPAAITPPSTFTVGKGPIGMLY